MQARAKLAVTTAVVFAALGVGSVSGAGALPSVSMFTAAGTGVEGRAARGAAATAAIGHPRSVAPTRDGGYVFAEPFNHTVRRVSAGGVITTLVGTGIDGFSGDGGPAVLAQVNLPHAASPTADGGFLIADTLNNRIRKISADGTITTVAGNGRPGYRGDGGPATLASIDAPRGVAALPDGGFLIPDSNNHRVRHVSPSGTITTVAGTGVQGFEGDGGPATAAKLSIPFGVAPTADGGFLIADVGNHRIRRVTPDGTITTIAGTGVAGYDGDDKPATEAALWNPHNVRETASGLVLIADTSNARIRAVSQDGTITTVAGNGKTGFGGDGDDPTRAQLSHPKDVAETASGQFLVADAMNHRIRLIGTALTLTRSGALRPKAVHTVPLALPKPGGRITFAARVPGGRARMQIICGRSVVATRHLARGRSRATLERRVLRPGNCRATLRNTSTSRKRFSLSVRVAAAGRTRG